MAITFADGFDYYAIGLIARKWTLTSGGSIQTGVHAGNCVRLAASGNVIQKTIAGVTTIGVSFYLRLSSVSTAGDLLLFREGGTTHVALRINTSGQLQICRSTGGATVLGTSTNNLSVNTWYHVELKVTIHDSTGAAEVRVTGSATGWLALTGVDTRNGGTGTLDNLRFNQDNNNNYDIDHVVFWDTTGSVNNNFLGETKIITLYPDADGSVDNWTANGAANQFECVDETSTDDDTTYISAAAAATVQLFSLGTLSAGTIRAAVTNMVARKDDAGAYTLREKCKSGVTTANGASQLPTTSYLNFQEIREVDPNTSAAWTQTNLNNAEFGVEQV